jgi:hypothetical protein
MKQLILLLLTLLSIKQALIAQGIKRKEGYNPNGKHLAIEGYNPVA